MAVAELSLLGLIIIYADGLVGVVSDVTNRLQVLAIIKLLRSL